MTRCDVVSQVVTETVPESCPSGGRAVAWYWPVGARRTLSALYPGLPFEPGASEDVDRRVSHRGGRRTLTVRST